MSDYICVFICIYVYLCVDIVMCDYLCLFLIMCKIMIIYFYCMLKVRKKTDKYLSS